jgi:predicted ATPase/DNA-binding SARP family transcriptional activator
MYTLSLFGPVSIEESGQPIQGIRSRKAIALLAYVAVHNKPLSRSHLAEFFWPKEPEARGHANLRWVLNHLRSLLPGALTIDRHSVIWGNGMSCDLHLFRQNLQRNTHATLSAAAELYQGDLMDGFVLEGVPDFEMWLATEREHWLQQAIHVVSTLVHHAGKQGNAHQAIYFSRRWVEIAPWHEEAHRWLIYWLAMSGQASAALTQYKVCVDTLADELGIAPSAETTALYEEIKEQGLTDRAMTLTPLLTINGQSTTPLRSDNLPRQLLPVVGREKDLIYIGERLADPKCALLTLVGPGGVGKSVLALEAAHAQLPHFADGVWFVPLVGIASADQLATSIAQTLAVPLQRAGDVRLQLLNFLSGKQLLLVLDNFEHLLDGSDLLDAILQAAPQVKLLITSREYLHHHAEWVFDVRGLVVPPEGTTEDLAQYSAVQLFLQSAQRTHAAYTMTEADAPHVAHICRTLGGLPLGIKLAAAWVRTLPCAAIAAEIPGNLDFAMLTPHGLPDRHRSLRALLDSSWQRLSAQEQSVLTKLAVFRRDFSVEAAIAVTGTTVSVLARLVDKTLLQFDYSDDYPRYSLHELLRHFAAEKLAATGQSDAVRTAHARYYTHWLDQQMDALTGPHPQPTLRRIDLELDNVRAAWQWAVDTCDATAIMAAVPVLSLYYDYRTLLQEGLQCFADASTYLRHALADVDEGPVKRRLSIACARVLGYYGIYLFRFSQPLATQEVLLESLDLATRYDAIAEKAYALYVLGFSAAPAGKPEKGEAYLLSGLALAESLHDKTLVTKILYALGWHYCELGQVQKSLSVLEQALTIARDMGNLRSEAHVLDYLGMAYAKIEAYAQARQHYEESLKLFQALEVHWGIAQAEFGLLRVAYELEDYTTAKQLCEKLIPSYEKIQAHANSLEQIREIYARILAREG